MYRVLFYLLFFVFSASILAETVTVKGKDGRRLEYRDIEILSGDITGINISYKAKITINRLGEEINAEYEGGATKLPFRKMIKADRDRFGNEYGYDPDKAEAIMEARKKTALSAMSKRRELNKLDTLTNIKLSIIKVEDKGAFCEVGPDIEIPKEPVSLEDGRYEGPKHYQRVMDAYNDKLKSLARRVDEFEKAHPELRKPIFVLGLGSIDNHADGEEWRGDIYACGVIKSEITTTYHSFFEGVETSIPALRRSNSLFLAMSRYRRLKTRHWSVTEKTH